MIIVTRNKEIYDGLYIAAINMGLYSEKNEPEEGRVKIAMPSAKEIVTQKTDAKEVVYDGHGVA